MLRSRTILHAAPVAVLLVLTLSCGAAHDSDEFFVLVSANLQLPYWKAAGSGFSNAAAQMKVRSDFVGPSDCTTVPGKYYQRTTMAYRRSGSAYS